MKVLCLSEADYRALRTHLERELDWWQTEVTLAKSFRQQNGIKWHSAALLRLRRFKAAHLLRATRFL